MAHREGLVFNVMSSAYRNGVLDKCMAMTGEAIDGALLDSGLKMGDLVNKIDEAQERTVMRMDRLLSHAGLLLKAAASDSLMKMASRLLDVSLVRRTVVRVMKRGMLKAATSVPAVPERGCAS